MLITVLTIIGAGLQQVAIGLSLILILGHVAQIKYTDFLGD